MMWFRNNAYRVAPVRFLLCFLWFTTALGHGSVALRETPAHSSCTQELLEAWWWEQVPSSLFDDDFRTHLDRVGPFRDLFEKMYGHRLFLVGAIAVVAEEAGVSADVVLLEPHSTYRKKILDVAYEFLLALVQIAESDKWGDRKILKAYEDYFWVENDSFRQCLRALHPHLTREGFLQAVGLKLQDASFVDDLRRQPLNMKPLKKRTLAWRISSVRGDSFSMTLRRALEPTLPIKLGPALVGSETLTRLDRARLVVAHSDLFTLDELRAFELPLIVDVDGAVGDDLASEFQGRLTALREKIAKLEVYRTLDGSYHETVTAEENAESRIEEINGDKLLWWEEALEKEREPDVLDVISRDLSTLEALWNKSAPLREAIEGPYSSLKHNLQRVHLTDFASVLNQVLKADFYPILKSQLAGELSDLIVGSPVKRTELIEQNWHALAFFLECAIEDCIKDSSHLPTLHNSFPSLLRSLNKQEDSKKFASIDTAKEALSKLKQERRELQRQIDQLQKERAQIKDALTRELEGPSVEEITSLTLNSEAQTRLDLYLRIAAHSREFFNNALASALRAEMELEGNLEDRDALAHRVAQRLLHWGSKRMQVFLDEYTQFHRILVDALSGENGNALINRARGIPRRSLFGRLRWTAAPFAEPQFPEIKSGDRKSLYWLNTPRIPTEDFSVFLENTEGPALYYFLSSALEHHWLTRDQWEEAKEGWDMDVEASWAPIAMLREIKTRLDALDAVEKLKTAQPGVSPGYDDAKKSHSILKESE